jgi:aryl-alcohol dehydrogenase-like predicted oxidoreductase
MQYREFGTGTGLRVSNLILGTAVFGRAWGYGAEPEEARAILEDYVEAGGNFIDTADFYQFGQAETIIGDFLGDYRERLVVATKYTLGASPVPSPLGTGNSRLNMIRSVDASLKRLKTDRIDLLWIHMPDGLTTGEEMLRGIDDLTRAGKIVYTGFSDFPAWRVSAAATMAELRNWPRIVGLQTEYSLVERTSDRELLPMAQAFGMGVAAWSPLGGGLLTGKYRRGEEGRADTFGAVIHKETDGRVTSILDALVTVADRRGAEPLSIALAWLIDRGVFPIIGPRTKDQLLANMKWEGQCLTKEELALLDSASSIASGFPHDFLLEDSQRQRLAGGIALRATIRPI